MPSTGTAPTSIGWTVGASSMDQPKFERMLRLMTLLTGNTSLSVDDLASRLDTTYRSIYRYLDTFKDAGFAVIKVRSGVYQLVKTRRNLPDFAKIVHFSDEEAAIVNGLIESLDNTNALKQNLHQKLAAIYDCAPVTDYVAKKSNALNIRELSTAIKEEHPVILHDYTSSHSEQKRDRRIEPFALTTNYINVWGYDLEDGRNKMFTISRIGEVEVLPDDWVHKDEHQQYETDLFHMTGSKDIHVKLRMTMLAKNLLIEEYPLAAEQVSKDGKDHWLLETDVCNLKGVGRFVIGLADHIEVIDSPELKNYIRDFIPYLYK